MERSVETFPEKSFRTETIEEFVSEGWKFRVKEVGRHRYIIRYMGRKEKSLGPYSDELWRLIGEEGGEKAKPRKGDTLFKEISSLTERISRLEGFEESARRKCESCPQIGSWYGYRYCKLLSWETKPTKLIKIYSWFKFMRIMPDRVEKKWYVEPNLDLCRMCVLLLQIPFNLVDDLNEARKKIETLNDDLRGVKSSLECLKDSASRRVMDDNNGCKHIQPDGYCGYWRWYQRRWDREQKEDTITKDGKLTKVYRDNVKKNPLVCAACPWFEPRGPNA